MSPDSLRWRDYFLRDGDGFAEFWTQFLTERKRDLLFVLGHGFDARMCEGVERIIGLGGEGSRDVALIAFDEGAESPSQTYLEQRKANGERLEKLVQGRGKIGVTVQPRAFSEPGRMDGRIRT